MTLEPHIDYSFHQVLLLFSHRIYLRGITSIPCTLPSRLNLLYTNEVKTYMTQNDVSNSELREV